jgi:hypothetical protein
LPSISLIGDRASIVDPCFAGILSFHHQEKASGSVLNQKAEPADPFPIE